jgi:hypothetical protein
VKKSQPKYTFKQIADAAFWLAVMLAAMAWTSLNLIYYLITTSLGQLALRYKETAALIAHRVRGLLLRFKTFWFKTVLSKDSTTR